MNKLLKLQKSLERFLQKVAAVGRENFVLWSIERNKKFKELKYEFYQAFTIQTSEFLRQPDLWIDIKDKIGKQEEPVWTDDDERQIREVVEEKSKPLSKYIKPAVIMTGYIWFANRGGQAFLDKQKINQKFDLKDAGIIQDLGNKVDLLIDTVDNTSKKWIGNQIIKGKKIGLSDVDIANKIREKIPETYKYRSEAIVRTEMAEIVNKMELETAVRNQASFKTWFAAGLRICPVCQENDGEKVGINGTFSSGDSSPPIHPLCYHKDTEVLTKNGWERINNVLSEKVLSLNPKTFNLEYVKIKRKIKIHSDKLIYFKSKRANIAVTPNHKMFYQTDWDSKKNKKRFKFIEAKELKDKKCGRFYASSEWKGKNIKPKLAGRKVSQELYAEFMGWYLSEGNCNKRGREITIYQSLEKNKDKYNKIDNLLEKLKFNYRKNSQGLVIKNKILWKELNKFGKANKKYVPQIIKDSNKEIIRIFLNTYCLGDGTIRKGKKWKNGNFKDTLVYTTSSKRMADSLGELIIKVGKRPSYKINKIKGNKQKFSNGIYEIKNDVWIITECHSRYIRFENLEIKEKKYNDFAYCLELEKFHTLFVRKNGKCVWSGNCKCLLEYEYTPIGQSWSG